MFNICTPAKLYFIISIILLIFSFYYDTTRDEKDKICLGKLSCKIENKPVFYLLNILFILSWAAILNILCYFGWSRLSWFLFLFPYIILGIIFVLIVGLVIFVARSSK
jgi:amino acid transporter